MKGLKEISSELNKTAENLKKEKDIKKSCRRTTADKR